MAEPQEQPEPREQPESPQPQPQPPPPPPPPPRYQACPFACIACTECATVFATSNETTSHDVLKCVRLHERRYRKEHNPLGRDKLKAQVDQALQSLSIPLAFQHVALQQSGKPMNFWCIYSAYLAVKNPQEAYQCPVCQAIYQGTGSHYKTECYKQQKAAAAAAATATTSASSSASSIAPLVRVEIYTCPALASKSKSLGPLIPASCDFDPASTPFCAYYQRQLTAYATAVPIFLADQSNTSLL